MSDFAWIALIIIIYFVIIRPMFQGVLQKNDRPQQKNKPGTGKHDEKSEADYTDYEELK